MKLFWEKDRLDNKYYSINCCHYTKGPPHSCLELIIYIRHLYFQAEQSENTSELHVFSKQSEPFQTKPSKCAGVNAVLK